MTPYFSRAGQTILRDTSDGFRSGFCDRLHWRQVELVREGRNDEELAREFQTTSQSIRNSVAQADRDERRRSHRGTTAERLWRCTHEIGGFRGDH